MRPACGVVQCRRSGRPVRHLLCDKGVWRGCFFENDVGAADVVGGVELVVVGLESARVLGGIGGFDDRF